ncbi:putative ribonuclease H-like domain-containing protein [Tanacetum coccineum]
MKKMYCLVVTEDFSRFSWVFFLATKDETSKILKTFITCIENLTDLRVKVIRCDNGTEFNNRVMNQFYEMKGIKMEFSVAKTPQQNEVAERKNRTLIESARTMLADSKLPTTFWAKAVNTVCYVQNRVLVIKPHNKNPYELFLGKFDGKADEGFFVGYSINSKAFRVFNSRTRIVEENLHVQFSENTPNIAGSGPNWLFDIDALTKSMNYKPVVAGNQSNGNTYTKAYDDTGKARMETVPGKDYILLPLWPADPLLSQNSKSGDLSNDQEKEDDNVNSTNNINTASDRNNTNNVNAVSSTFNAAGIEVNVVGTKTRIELLNDPNMPELEDIIYSNDYEDVGVEADMNNLNTFIPKNPKRWWTPTITLIVIHARAEHAVVVSLMEFCLSLYLLKWKSIDFSTRADYSLDSDSLKDSLILQQQNLCVKIVGDPHATIENQSEDFSDSNVESTSTDEIPSLVTIEMLRHPSQIRAR